MTDPNSVTQSQTAAAMLRGNSESETEMLYYLLNLQAQTENHWQLPDGSSVICHLDTGCYEFVSPDGTSVLEYAGAQPERLGLNSGHIAWHILKKAAAEAGVNDHPANDPPLSATEAMTLCPELDGMIYQTLDQFEPDDHTLSCLDYEVGRIVEHIRRRINPDRWQTIVAASRERARQQT